MRVLGLRAWISVALLVASTAVALPDAPSLRRDEPAISSFPEVRAAAFDTLRARRRGALFGHDDVGLS